uniref:EGF-like domain-containing protein n=1 Tax=Hucho hucho TaxID=62062 RepID=A0A4W5KY73_9TELE
MCVNTPGSFMCICHTGYIRIDDYSCTEHDECTTGLHRCDENAICFNTVGGHSCSCKPGYVGNGTVCRGETHTRIHTHFTLSGHTKHHLPSYCMSRKAPT